MSSPYLAVYGENEKIINDCFNMEMSEYQKTRFVSKLLFDRKFELAIRICEKNDIKDLYIYKNMLVPLDVIKKIKCAKVSGHYTSLDNRNLVLYWYNFIEENNLDYEMPSCKLKVVKCSFSDKPEDLPKKIII